MTSSSLSLPWTYGLGARDGVDQVLAAHRADLAGLARDGVGLILVGVVLFSLGLSGVVFNRKNIISVLMSLELMLLAINLIFLLGAHHADDGVGQLFALVILTVAAAEAAIGLAILVLYYRVRRDIRVDTLVGA